MPPLLNMITIIMRMTITRTDIMPTTTALQDIIITTIMCTTMIMSTFMTSIAGIRMVPSPHNSPVPAAGSAA